MVADVNGIPNTRVTILRGKGSDEFGDEADLDIPVATGVLASLHMLDNVTSSQAADRQQQIGVYSLRVKHGTDVRIDDRIRDAEGNTYVIADVTSQPSIGRRVDVRCRMRKLESA